MELEDATYARYLRDIGGESRLNRDLPNEDKLTYSKEYGTTALQSEIKAQQKQDLSFSEYIRGMQESLVAGQRELDNYSTTALETLDQYKTADPDAYRHWYSSQPMGKYFNVSSSTSYRAGGTTYPASDKLIAWNPLGTLPIVSIPTSIGDPMLDQYQPYGAVSLLGTGSSSDPVYQSWASEMKGLYEPAYQKYLTNLHKYQGELSLAESKVQGEMDVHQETLDAMKQRYTESVKRRTDNLKQLRVGGQV